jgi:uncharacterized membrane protein YoaK (UPF0700 family)
MAQSYRKRRSFGSPSSETGVALARLAALLAMLAGMVDAVGFMAFGQVFLASPDATATILGTNLPAGSSIVFFAGAMILSFVAGVTLMTLATYRLSRLRRTSVIAGSALILTVAFVTFDIGIAFAPAALLALALGGVHCVFERDNSDLQDALSPSAQIGRLGEALAAGRSSFSGRRVAAHALFWLACILGGVMGVAAWFLVGARAFAMIAGFAAVLILPAWSLERRILPTYEY